MVHSSALFKIKQQNYSGKKDLIDYYGDFAPTAEKAAP
jgi:hypothetical protein